MSGLNKVMIIGNLGKEPEMRYTANGKARTTFSVAVNRRSGEKEDTDWFNVVTWEKTAESCAEHLVKGQQVYVEGRLQTRKWEGSDGAMRYITEVIAQNVTFLGKKGEGHLDTEGPIDLDDVPFDD